jgi:hypothetical protein
MVILPNVRSPFKQAIVCALSISDQSARSAKVYTRREESIPEKWDIL